MTTCYSFRYFNFHVSPVYCFFLAILNKEIYFFRSAYRTQAK